MHFLKRALDTVLPYRCPVSGEIVTQHGMVAPHIWRELDFISDPFCKTCGTPFDYELDGSNSCAKCIEEPPPYKTSRAALRYNEASRSIILGFKHADRTFAVKTFTPWVKTAGHDMLAKADYIMPVPLHMWRLIRRRYNQAELLSSDLGKESGVPVIKNALIRKHATRSQGHLKPEDRASNVKDAFAVNPRAAEKIKGKTVILIDDVYTTGATAKECTDQLLKSGVGEVHVLTIANVGHEDPLM